MNAKLISVLIFSFLFFFLFTFVNTSLAATNVRPDDERTSGQAGETTIISIDEPENAAADLGQLIGGAINAIIIIAGLLVFIYLVWGGIEWLTSGGDKEKYESARNRITAAVIGLVIVVAAWAVMKLIGNFLGINFQELVIKPMKDF